MWLVTVAMAVFDLALVIFEDMAWSGNRREIRELKAGFVKFLIIVVTALSIESLVLFFKVAKKDVTLLIHPAIAIFSVCLLIISLGIYLKLSARDEASARSTTERD